VNVYKDELRNDNVLIVEEKSFDVDLTIEKTTTEKLTFYDETQKRDYQKTKMFNG
jgi:hypothetical protein